LSKTTRASEAPQQVFGSKQNQFSKQDDDTVISLAQVNTVRYGIKSYGKIKGSASTF